MKYITIIIMILALSFSSSSAQEKKNCKEEKSFVQKMKCKASNLKSKKILKGTLEFQKKAFEKKSEE